MSVIIGNQVIEETEYDEELYEDEMNITIPDKKYFHLTEYATRFQDIFGVELKSNKEQFDLTFNTYKTLFKVYKSAITYKQNKIERYNAIRKILEKYFELVKSKINKCWDKYCIELYEDYEKWYDELLEMEQKNRYNFQNIIDRSESHIICYDLDFRLTANSIDSPNRKVEYKDGVIYKIRRTPTFDYYNGEYENHSDFLKRFKRKYKYELTLEEYSYVMDTLTIIIYIQNHIDNKETMNKGLNAYFKDYPQKININDDFNTNYDMLSFIFQCEDINVIKLIFKNLIQKNIYFLEEN